ncbi:hypothetical protein Fmac_026564 [Flemingia macrophylla]|uniref:Uncharacterized protein n=1 Tax=Flemingia macrophylla TaxID=520843 RepID=A0ABD1LF82_9FABA
MDPDVTNIAGIVGMTRSGRIYTPDNLQDKAPKEEIRGKGRTEEKKKESKEIHPLQRAALVFHMRVNSIPAG